MTQVSISAEKEKDWSDIPDQQTHGENWTKEKEERIA